MYKYTMYKCVGVMYIYMYIYMYVYMYMYMYINMYTQCMCICILSIIVFVDLGIYEIIQIAEAQQISALAPDASAFGSSTSDQER